MTCSSASLGLAAACLAALALGGAGCGGGAEASSGAGGAAGTGGAAGEPVFIAFAADFQGYTAWTKMDLGEVAPTDNEIPGPRTLYLNHAPPRGASEFPVGTIIVKAIEVGAPSAWQVFAMVKRGGGFNYVGAQGWEWFELTQTDAFDVAIEWRGIAPPSGMGYGGGSKGGVCNTCHIEAASNDYVAGDAFSLSRF